MQAVPRSSYLGLIRVKPSTLEQRMHTGEQAFALGVSKPAHRDEYLLLDGVAAILASMLNCTCGLTLKQAADAVREHWAEWLELLVRVENWAEHHQDDPRLFFAVA